ncbi:MAG: hypothetical protein ACK559_03350, partial [bacterium]
ICTPSDLHLLNYLQINCSLLIWQKIAQFERDFLLMLAASLCVDHSIAGCPLILILFFRLLFSFDFSLENSIIDLH